MTDYLVKCLSKGVADVEKQQDAAALIEGLEANAIVTRVAIMRLEAKLAKAVEFAEIVKRTGHGELEFLARDMIAELKGKTNE